MAKCIRCSGNAYSKEFIPELNANDFICRNCRKALRQEAIAKKLESVEKSADFKPWAATDLSEAFWLHLGIYTKHPNQRSLSILNMAFNWAVHADKGLANSFGHALKWCGIDLYGEGQRTDLPARHDG